MTARIHNIGDAPVSPELQGPVLIPPGEYEMKYALHRIERRFNRGALEIYFNVLDYDHVALPRYYKITLLGKHRFRVGRGSDLVRDFHRVFPARIKRLDRIPLHWLKDVRLMGTIGTVTHDHEGKSLADETQYSVVRELQKC